MKLLHIKSLAVDHLSQKLLLMRRKRKSRLGPAFGWARGQRDQLVSSLEGRQGRCSFLVWGVVLACIVAISFTLPVGVIRATTNQV